MEHLLFCVMLKPYTNYNCQSTLHQWFTIELTKKRLLLKHVFLSSWLCRVSCKEINKNHCLCNCWVDTCDKDLRKKIRDADTLALSTTWKGEDAQSACEWQRVSREKKKDERKRLGREDAPVIGEKWMDLYCHHRMHQQWQINCGQEANWNGARSDGQSGYLLSGMSVSLKQTIEFNNTNW